MVRLRLWPTAAGPLERRHDRRDHGRHTELEEGAGGVPRRRPLRQDPDRTQTNGFGTGELQRLEAPSAPEWRSLSGLVTTWSQF